MTANGRQQTHTLHDIDALGTEIDLSTHGAEGGETFTDGDMMAGAGEPEGQGRASASSAADENAKGWHQGDMNG